MKIIGVGGTNGSGKDTLAGILVEQGWLFVSVSNILREELERRKAPIERENLRSLSAEWRRKHNAGHLIDKAVEIFDSQKHEYNDLVISSLRNFGEATGSTNWAAWWFGRTPRPNCATKEFIHASAVPRTKKLLNNF